MTTSFVKYLTRSGKDARKRAIENGRLHFKAIARYEMAIELKERHGNGVGRVGWAAGGVVEFDGRLNGQDAIGHRRRCQTSFGSEVSGRCLPPSPRLNRDLYRH